jgi:hypothetical protein
MSLAAVSQQSGTSCLTRSSPERRAALRYLDALARRSPDLVAKATAGLGNDGTVYGYAPVPAEDEQDIAL